MLAHPARGPRYPVSQDEAQDERAHTHTEPAWPRAAGASNARRVGTRGQTFNDLMRVLSQVLDFDDGAKLFHAWRVALVAHAIGGVLGRDVGLLFHAGLVHDLGGLGVSEGLVHCAAGTGPPEVRSHAARGARILRPLTALRALAAAHAISVDEAAGAFEGAKRELVARHLETLAILGEVRDVGAGRFATPVAG